MDARQFDGLVKSLAGAATRRGVLRGLAGSVAAGALALRGAGRVAADDTPKPVGKKCNKDAQCASGVCDRATKKCADPNACPTYSRCGSVCFPPDQGGGCYPTPNLVTCGAEPGCLCLETIDRTTACVRDVPGRPFCRTSGECGDGEACVFEPCQINRQAGFCVPLCGQGG